MVLFGSRVTKVIDFEDSHKGLSYLQDKILNVKHRREGMTSTATALNFVKETMLGKVTDLFLTHEYLCQSLYCDNPMYTMLL